MVTNGFDKTILLKRDEKRKYKNESSRTIETARLLQHGGGRVPTVVLPRKNNNFVSHGP